NLGALQMIRGNRDEAEAAFKQAVATDPKSPQGYLALANFYWAARRPDEAEAQLKTALSVDPKNDLVNRALGYFYMGTGRAAEAEAPPKSTGKLTLSDYYLTVRRFDDARRTLEAVPKSDAQNYLIARLKLAALDVQSGDRQGADALVNEVLAKEPNSVDALIVKAQLLVTDGKFDEALATGGKAIPNARASAQAQCALGRLLVARHDSEGAMNAFNEALKLNPSLAQVEMELAKLHLDAGRIDQAKQFALSAATKISGYAEAQIVLSHLERLQGRLDSADRTLNELVKALPGAPVVQTEFGRLQLVKGNRAEARSAFERALSKNPNFVDALSVLTQMDLEDKHPDVARARVDAAVKRNGTAVRTQ